ncbi:MAG TPA: hypothetical protein DCQ06_02210 [Myxococcales bacterium]|nr:hypothetical protein [Myxococcales bacterium]HAN30388.1 hypothetical protein [Myxococcales bacterium]
MQRRSLWYRSVTRHVGLSLIVLMVLAPALDAEARRRRRRRARVKPPATATIEILSMTKGATIFIDDRNVGRVPLNKPVTVSPNQSHVVRLQKRGFTPYVETVRLKPGTSRELEADLVPSGGILQVICNVRRAQVLLDGKPIGRTPFDGDIPAGKHKLEVVAPGKQPQSRLVDLRAGNLMKVAFVLKAPPPPVVKKDNSVFGRWWFWTAVGAAVIGGATAAALASRDVQVSAPQPNLTLKLSPN